MSHAGANDVQQGIVYGFERQCVERIAPSVMSRPEIEELVFKASSLSRIRVPTILFRGDSPNPCLADIRLWRLTINDWGRNPCTILHEIGHLVTFEDPAGRAEMHAGQYHGPHFVRHAIDLYSDFINVPRAALEKAAREFGLEIAPRLVSDAPKTAFFDDDI